LANLACLLNQDLGNLAETILVFDGSRNPDLEARVTREFPRLRCRFLYYSPFQRFLTRLVRWPWINSWLSWSKAIAAVTTRYAVLHDFDAMLLHPSFLDTRYRQIRAGGCEYLGVRYYSGLGILPEDGLVTTFELFFDCRFVRETFRPIDLFNHVSMWRGRSVEFDTFLFAQSQAGRTRVIPADLDTMVHPSQLICQFAYHQNGDPRLPAATNNLMILPYFLAVGGDPSPMHALTVSMSRDSSGWVTFFRRPLKVCALSQAHVKWIVKQITHLETALFGQVRPEVQAYLDAFQGAGLPPTADASPGSPSGLPQPVLPPRI
jgi:hypothetical protein